MEKESVEKEVEETTVQPADAEETTGSSMSEEDASKQTEDDQDVDFYKRRVLELEAQKERAEKKIVKMKRESRDESDEQPDDIKSIVRDVLMEQEALREENSRREYIDSSVEDENQKKLVEHYLNNRIKPSGDFKEDVDLALAFIEREKLRNENVALKDAQLSRNTAGGAEFSGHRRNKRERDTRSAAQKEFERKFREANNLPIK